MDFLTQKPRRPGPPPWLVVLALGGAGWLTTVLAGAILGGVHARAISPESASGVGSALVGADAAAAVLSAAPATSGAAPDAGPPAPPAWRVSALAKDPNVVVAGGALGHRTLLDALVAEGLPRAEAYRLIRAFNSVHHFDKCNPKDTFSFAKEKEKEGGRLIAFEYASSPTDVWQARQNDAGELEAKKLELTVEHPKVKVGIAVTDDLRASITQAGLDDDLLEMLDDALDGHAELADLRAGARLRIIATEDRVDGAFAGYESLDAVEYTPASPTAPPVRVYRFGTQAPAARGGAKHGDPVAAYFDAHGREPYHGGWRTPVPLARIASRFNPRRMHPVLHTIVPHNGVDFAAPIGTPVYATATGTVKSVGDSGPCGNMVQLAHASGMVSAYCHLSRFAAGLHPGQHVEARQVVGYVGRTGRTTGPHLHFAIKRNDMFIDPLALKLDGVRVVPLAERAEFERIRAELDIALDGIALPAAILPDGGAGDSDGGVDESVFEEATE